MGENDSLCGILFDVDGFRKVNCELAYGHKGHHASSYIRRPLIDAPNPFHLAPKLLKIDELEEQNAQIKKESPAPPAHL